jgi:hypothetical protein
VTKFDAAERLVLLQAEVRKVIDGDNAPTRKALLQSLVEEIQVAARDLPVFSFADGSTTSQDQYPRLDSNQRPSA